jgi:hypothetical protein
MFDNLRIDEQLSTPIHVSESLTATIDSQAQYHDLSLKIGFFHIAEVVQLIDEERLKA